MLLTEYPINHKKYNLTNILSNGKYKLYIYDNGEDDIIDFEIINRFKYDIYEYLKTHSNIYC